MHNSNHFSGKPVPEHLKEARRKGALASSEVHGTELSGFTSAYTDTTKETTILFILTIFPLHALFGTSLPLLYFLILAGLWIVWRTIRSALLGWARIERLHRLIEEERWEIEHHRAQEKEELIELYRAKGLQGKLLEETVEVLMADDNRLLQVMLEEELGLSLEVYEHPLQQASGALLGGVTTLALFLIPLWLHCTWGLYLATAAALCISSILQAKHEGNRTTPLVVWNLAAATLLIGLLHYLMTTLHVHF